MTRSANGTDGSVFESIKPALIGAGYIDEETDRFVGDPRKLVAGLIVGLRELEFVNPWGETFALMVRTDWCSLDGTDPGDVQVRVTENGMQLRERTPSTLACTTLGHFAETCDDCWTVCSLEPSDRWHSVTSRVQVRIGDSSDNASSVRRIEVRRRMCAGVDQSEAVWSEPWPLQKYTTTELYKTHRDDRDIDTTWVDATPMGDVQVSEGHTFPRGILVRRATGREDAPWTTPTFLPETHWRWSDLLPDGSLQFRCWRTSEEERGWGNYRIEIRQHVGRNPVLAVEPVWGERKSGYGEGRPHSTNGYTVELLREPYRYRSNIRSVMGVQVVDPYGVTRDILVTDRYVRAAPDLLVNASSQGSFTWRNGTPEPETETIVWSMPGQRTLRTREWTMLDNNVRARVTRGLPRGIRVEILQDEPVRRHWWLRRSPWVSDGIKPFGTAHDITSTLRVTFRPDQVAEIQSIASAVLD